MTVSPTEPKCLPPTLGSNVSDLSGHYPLPGPRHIQEKRDIVHDNFRLLAIFEHFAEYIELADRHFERGCRPMTLMLE